MKTSLVLMAAGFGTRFGGGIKQLEPVGPNGEILMEYAIHDALAAGFDRVIFIIRRDLEESFRQGVGRRVEKKCDVAYVFQQIDDLPLGFSCPTGRRKPWGTGQAVWACRNTIHEPFCVLNADDYYGAEAFRRIHAFLEHAKPENDGLELCMAGYVLGNTLSQSGAVTRGICRANADGRLERLEETRGVTMEGGVPCVHSERGLLRLDPASVVSMNIWGMPRAFIEYLEEGFRAFLSSVETEVLTAEFLLPNAVSDMIAQGRGEVCVLPTSDQWFGMTYAQDKLRTQTKIRELIAEGRYPERL